MDEGLSEFLEDEHEGELGDEAGPASISDNHRESVLEPKHKVFLSHSGAQKNFTKQLCVDLESRQCFPFFDKCLDSLPKGKNFPKLIFRATQQCVVVVLILSEEFFTRTKWPMLELEAFMRSQKEGHGKIKILPIYLGLLQHECKNETRQLGWRSVWEHWAKEDERVKVKKCEKALKVLGWSNGIEYVEALGEVALRKQIVDAIMKLAPLKFKRGDEHAQGRHRICKTMLEKVRGLQPSQRFGAARVIGLYGTGGLGKTTFCKVLCDEAHSLFKRRVCHVELKSNPSDEEQCELQKKVLQYLTDLNPRSLTSLGKAEIGNLLRRYIGQLSVFGCGQRLARVSGASKGICECRLQTRQQCRNDSA